jgi:PAS domain S-box-containing protein
MGAGLSRFDYDELFELPVPVYLVRRNGTFISGNRRLRQLLHLPAQGPLDAFSIERFYRSSEDRKRLLRKADAAKRRGKILEKETTAFRIDGRDYFLQVYCKSVHRRNTKGPPDYLGCLVDVSEEEMLRALVEDLPVGIYRADADGTLLHVNQAIVRMFGFSLKEQMEGKAITHFFTDSADIEAFAALNGGDYSQSSRVSEVTGKTGTRFQVSVRSAPILRDGSYVGHEGTVEDVTEREQLRDLVQKTPLGLYKVLNDQGRPIITNCNDSFAQLFGLADASKVIGKDIRTIQKIDSHYGEFLSALGAQERKGESLLHYTIRITPVAKAPFTVEVNCRLLRDPKTGKEIGRIGVLSDVTSDEERRELITAFTRDIGNVLHTYESMLVNLRSAIKPMRTTLAVGTERIETTTTDSLFQALDLSATTLAKVITELIQHIPPEVTLRTSDLSFLNHCLDVAAHYRGRMPLREFWATTFHEMAHKMLELSFTRLPHKVNREIIRRVRHESWKLARICSLISLVRIEDSVSQMDYQVRSLREYVTRGVRRPEPPLDLTIEALIDQAISNLTYFARFRRVGFKIDGPIQITHVRVQQRELVRSITNLLHNAVKYSWQREDGNTWVSVRCRQEATGVFIEVENYGVPIPAEEIESELIFEIGMRGRLAGDRGRIGTGIGLGDAREVARRQGGDLTIASVPARAGGKADDYSAPFLTTATIRLPI